MVLKVLEFRINDPNPLTYVEVLLEVLGKIYWNTSILRNYVLYIYLYLKFTVWCTVWPTCAYLVFRGLNFPRKQSAIHACGAAAWAVPPRPPVCQPGEKVHLWVLASVYHSVRQPIRRTEVWRCCFGTGGCCHGRVDEQLSRRSRQLRAVCTSAAHCAFLCINTGLLIISWYIFILSDNKRYIITGSYSDHLGAVENSL